MNLFTGRPKIGLALGGGGPKGLAHIGIIKVLEENNIPIDYIAGTSIGAMVGGFYAAKKNIYEIEKLALTTNWPKFISIFFDPTIRQGLIKGEKLKKFIEDYLGEINFKDLKIPFKAVATDLHSGEKLVIGKDKVSTAIKASTAIPLMFAPVKIDNRTLIDGGVSCPVPVETVRQMGADFVIAVNLTGNDQFDDREKKLTFTSIANNSLNILRYNLALENIQTADFVIAPKVGNIGWKHFFTYKGTEESIKLGVDALEPRIKELKEIINKRSQDNNIFQRLSKIFK